MPETILSITEHHGECHAGSSRCVGITPAPSWCKYDGWIIKTTEQTIFFGINNRQNCCEDWGMIDTPDNVNDFIGQTFLRIEEVSDIGENGACDYHGTVFINVVTDKDVLQFGVYNTHNGYYSHSVVIVSRDVNVDTRI